jgi:dTMP kinase
MINKRKDKGVFISMEGPDGSGKSTQTKLLYEYLKESGYDVVLTREPGGTFVGEKIRAIILDNNHHEMADRTESLLFAAARAQHVDQRIKPALEAGRIVVCDRFIDSSIVYQGYGRGLGDSVRIINEYAIDGCLPDRTLLLLVDPKTGIDRIAKKDQDRLELMEISFHERVYQGYLELMELYPERIVAVDGKGRVDEIAIEVRKQVDLLLLEVGK